MRLQSRQVNGCSIALVLVKPVLRVIGMHLLAKAIAVDFGQDGCSRNGGYQGIALNNRFCADVDGGQPVAVHHHETGYQREAGDREWQQFVNCLTTNLTAFFREEHHFPVLHDTLRALGSGASVRIWCNAASTGEEPYSLAMTVAETLGAAAQRWRMAAKQGVAGQ